MLQAFLTTFLFSASAICGNKSAKILGGVAANFYRIIVATLLLGCWAHTAGSPSKSAALGIFFFSGLIGFGIGDLALYQALPRIGSRISIMIVHCLAAPFAALLEWIWLGTTLSTVQMLCGVTILVGVAVALAPEGQLGGAPKRIMFGLGCAFIAALAQGLSSVISRKAYMVAYAAGEPIGTLTAGVVAAYERILGGVLIAGASFFLIRWRNSQRKPHLDELRVRGAWKWVVLNGIAGPGLGVVCYQWALASTPTGIVMPIVALSPLVIIPFARIFENEKPTPHSLFGGVVAVLGVLGLRLLK
jgi:drug/metabolite transporter (DMT)-like permease